MIMATIVNVFDGCPLGDQHMNVRPSGTCSNPLDLEGREVGFGREGEIASHHSRGTAIMANHGCRLQRVTLLTWAINMHPYPLRMESHGAQGLQEDRI